MPKPVANKYYVERELWLTSLDDIRLRLLAKQRGVPDADKLPRKNLVSELMQLGMSANPLVTPKSDRRI
jgi:hypothetical protein